MTVDLTQIHANTEEERIQWIDLLYSGIYYHKAMAIEVEQSNEILTLETTHSPDVMYHKAMANAIRDCISLIEMLVIDEDKDESTTDSDD